MFELSKVGLEQVPPRMVANLRNVDEDLAKRVADGLGIPLPQKSPAARAPIDMEPSPALSIHKNMKETLEGRKVGILIADGSDAAALGSAAQGDRGRGCRKLRRRAEGRRRETVRRQDDARRTDSCWARPRNSSTPSPSCCPTRVPPALAKEGAAVQWVMDAFGHLKAIGSNPAAKPLLDKAGVAPDDGVTGLDDAFLKAAAKRFWAREPNVRMLA